MNTFLVALLTSTASLADAWWRPGVGTTWQIVLSKPIKGPFPDVQAFDFDLFDNPASTQQALHQAGHKTICYFSAGSYEEWRNDAGKFTKADLGKPLDGWAGERWLNTRSANVRSIMKQRMDIAVKKGCDAIDPDNIDAYDNGGGGFQLTTADAADYVKFLAREGHKRGLAVGLKNGGKIIKQVLDSVDFQINEQCLQYSECPTFRPFINAGKPVFHIEYRKGTPSKGIIDGICSKPGRKHFSTLVKHMNLDGWYAACKGTSADILTAMPQSTGSMNADTSDSMSWPPTQWQYLLAPSCTLILSLGAVAWG